MPASEALLLLPLWFVASLIMMQDDNDGDGGGGRLTVMVGSSC